MRNLIEYDLFIPTVSREGAGFEAALLDGLKKHLVDRFGGLTDTRTRNDGLWKIGGQVVRDEIRIWRILSTEGSDGDAFMREFRRRLERELKEEMILIVRREVGQV
jgi:hypothetical protein